MYRIDLMSKLHVHLEIIALLNVRKNTYQNVFRVLGLMFVSYEHVYGSFICLLSADIRELNANHVINSLLRMFNDNESS